MIDALTALRLQLEWGADEALDEAPVDRFAAPPAPAPELPVERGPSLVAAASPAARPSPVAAQTLDALYAEIEAFPGCALRTTAMHTVRPDGNPAADLLVVGDAPSSDDDRSGRAFSGASGQVVDRVFASIGLDRRAMLLAPLVPWRPPGGRPLSDAEVQLCLPFLHRLIAIVRPERLVLVGGTALRALTGSAEPLRRVRGRWLEVKIPGEQLSIAALPMPQSDQWLRAAAQRRDVWLDLINLRRAITPT